MICQLDKIHNYHLEVACKINGVCLFLLDQQRDASFKSNCLANLVRLFQKLGPLPGTMRKPFP
jgi:hypothetical protein